MYKRFWVFILLKYIIISIKVWEIKLEFKLYILKGIFSIKIIKVNYNENN